MAHRVRHLRGLLVRAVLRRRPALAIGAALLAPALAVMVGEFRWESSLTDGLALVLGATGAAFVLAALGGRRPDWIE
ncbi:MAG: hypothetical protein HYZ58_16705 [Acidobacteria bacterium]|nr:hypothetical protein [Acidobacteriota bacterium]